MRKVLLFIFIIVCAGVNLASAQDDTTEIRKGKKPKLKKIVKAADRTLKRGNIYTASDLYEDILEKNPEHVATAYKLAHAYYISRDYKKAEHWFKKVTELEPAAYPLSQYYYALMLKMNAKYKEAKPIFEEFRKSYRGDDPLTYKKWAKIEEEGCDLALEMREDPVDITIIHLDSTVNSAYSDISPMEWNDSTLLFASLPTDTVIVVGNQRMGNDYYIKLYASSFNENEYEQAKVFEKFNEQGLHIANGAFSPDKKRFYFSKCEERRKSKIVCGIYVSHFEDGEWQYPQSLGTEINHPEFTSTQPNVAAYKRGSEILYFSSNRPGGRGGLDIWYSTISKSGDYSFPKNLGTRINTDRDEVTPLYNEATGSLFFSSNGHVNIGGHDIYRSEGSGSRWEDPVNVGYPINSSTDDMYFTVDKDSKRGYFVSNRPGIISIRSETCCDDIFAFKFIRLIDVAVEGFVYDEEDTTQSPLNNALVMLSLRSQEGVESDVEINQDNASKGDPYFFILNTDEEYKVTGSAKGYLTGWSNFNTKNLNESDTLRVDIYLKKLVKDRAYTLKNIYYDSDKATLRPEAKAVLDTLYNLLVENPTIIIELSSHTDTRSSNKYNLDLSQRRANSCIEYLIDKGISKDRLVATGYGEEKTLVDCTQDEDCPQDGTTDCPCHQLNRRTEFKIIGELDAELIYEGERLDERSGEVKEGKKRDKKK